MNSLKNKVLNRRGACHSIPSSWGKLLAPALLSLGLCAGFANAADPIVTTIAPTGFTAPHNGFIAEGNATFINNQGQSQKVRHLWIPDHLSGLCRVDPHLDTPGNPVFSLNLATCAPLPSGATVYDDQLKLVYIMDEVANNTNLGLVRRTFNPAGDQNRGSIGTTFVRLGDASSCGLRTARISAMALGPDGSLYLTALKDGNIRRINGPSNAAVPCGNFVNMAASGRRNFGLAWVGTTLYGLGDLGPWRIPGDATKCATPNVPSCGTEDVFTDVALIPGAIASNQKGKTPNGNILYVADINKVGRVNDPNGANPVVIPNWTPTIMSNPPSITVDTNSGTDPIVYVADDPGLGGSPIGRLFKISPAPVDPLPPHEPTAINAAEKDSSVVVSWTPGAEGTKPTTHYTVHGFRKDPVLEPVLEPVMVPVMVPAMVPAMVPVMIPVMVPVMVPQLDANGDPVLDANGQPILVPQLDANGQPVLTPQLDANGQPVLTPQLDANGQPVLTPQLDANGQPVLTPQLDANGNPVLAPQLDANGQPVLAQHIDANGNPVFVFTEIGTQDTAHAGVNPAPSTLTVTSLVNGTTYKFTVQANSADGNSGPSAASNEAIPHGATVPNAPAITNSFPGNTAAALTWSAPDDGGSPILNYTLRYNNGGATTTLHIPANKLGTTLTGLTSGATYNFELSAVNSKGEGEAASASLQIPAATDTNFLDVALSMAGPSQVQSSTNGVYTLQVSNTGAFTVPDVQLIVTLPTGAFGLETHTASAGACNVIGNQLRCDLGSMDVNQPPITVDLTLLNVTQALTLNASVAAYRVEQEGNVALTDAHPADNVRSVVTALAPPPPPAQPVTDLQINSGSASKAALNTAMTLTYGLRNGSGAANHVVFTLPFPSQFAFSTASAGAGATCTGANPGQLGGVVSCSIPTMAAGASRSLTFTLIPRLAGSYGLAGHVEFDGFSTDPNQANNTRTISVTVR